MTRPTINVWDAPWMDGYAIRINAMDHDAEFDKKRLVGVLSFVPAPPPGAACEATTVIDRSAAQKLRDELWNVGLRPTEGTGSAGSLRATEKQLQCMRQLVVGGKSKP